MKRGFKYHQLYGDDYEFEPLQNDNNTSRTTIDLVENDQNKIDYIIYVVQPGDTLQSISVKYSCPIPSIKRLNHIWSDHEFHARSRLKLPVGKFRLIADVIDAEQPTSSIVSNDHAQPTLIDPIRSPESSLSNFNSIIDANTKVDNLNNHTKSCDKSETDNIFKDVDRSLHKARDAALSYDANGDALMKILAETGNIVDDPSDISRSGLREAQTLLVDMSDNNLSYSGLILFMFILCLICPLAFVIYLEETSV